MDTKPLWLVPHVTGVDQRNVLKIISVFWNVPGKKDQTWETVTSESHCWRDETQRLETIQVVQLLPEAISQGGPLSRSPQTRTPQKPVFPNKSVVQSLSHV